MTKKTKPTFKCKGCQAATSDPKRLFSIDEYVHDDGCIFATRHQQSKTLTESITEIIVADIKARGPISEALKQCA